MGRRGKPAVPGRDVNPFGGAASAAPVERQPCRVTNDIGLVEEVLEVACSDFKVACSDFSYVLVGMAEQVYRKVDRERIEPVPVDIEHAVHQLLSAKWLTVGGCHYYRCGRFDGPASSVLVPKTTRDTLRRWGAVASNGLADYRRENEQPRSVA